MADNEIQKMIDDMKISIFNLENSYNQQKKQIDAVKNLISEIEGKFLANNENLENIELPSIEPIEEVTTVEENTEVVPEAPVESTEVAQETPVENTEVAQEAPVESTEVAQEAPVENTEVAQEAPVESTEVAQEVPVESTEVVQETPVESTEVVPEAPVESTEVVQETPVESTEVVQEAPVESTEVVQEAPVENITEEVVVASNQLDDAADEVVEAPKIEDIPAPESPFFLRRPIGIKAAGIHVSEAVPGSEISEETLKPLTAVYKTGRSRQTGPRTDHNSFGLFKSLAKLLKAIRGIVGTNINFIAHQAHRLSW